MSIGAKMDDHEKTGRGERLALNGVPETMLWPLWHRANEARRKNRLIDDPMAADLIRRIDYDFRGRFGRPNALHPIRARVCDDLISSYLNSKSAPIVIALGEGLETQFWRIGSQNVRWFSVDVPEAIAVRERFLPPSAQISHIARSALDLAWMDAVPTDETPFISICGLLMYFTEEDVRMLLSAIAGRFPQAEVFFDTIPPLFSEKTMRGFKVTRRYTAPPMPWGVRLSEIGDFLAEIPNLHLTEAQSYADPFPSRTPIIRLLSMIGGIRNALSGGLIRCRAA